MTTYAIEWELHEGVALREQEALARAERERLVRELRAERRSRRRRPQGWLRRNPLSRKEILAGR
jgi:hypothetical protein